MLQRKKLFIMEKQRCHFNPRSLLGDTLRLLIVLLYSSSLASFFLIDQKSAEDIGKKFSLCSC